MPDLNHGLALDTNGQPCVWQNHYLCECGATWDDEWSCQCDDECPSCGDTVSPEDSTWIAPWAYGEDMPVVQALKEPAAPSTFSRAWRRLCAAVSVRFPADEFMPLGPTIKETLQTLRSAERLKLKAEGAEKLARLQRIRAGYEPDTGPGGILIPLPSRDVDRRLPSAVLLHNSEKIEAGTEHLARARHFFEEAGEEDIAGLIDDVIRAAAQLYPANGRT